MNCQQFESHIVELSRGESTQAAARADAFSHAELCARCATRLADERALTDVLREFAGTSVEIEPTPARVEVALLDAFRARQLGVPASSRVDVAPQTMSDRARWAHRASAAAALAASLLLCIVAARHWQKNPSPANVEQAKRAQPSRVDKAGIGLMSANTATIASPPQPEDDGMRAHPRARQPQLSSFKTVRAGRSAEATFGENRATSMSGAAPTIEIAGNASDAENLTDFLPLAGADTATPLESGQVVRVELPRATLASFGLPLNVERDSQTIKADILLGTDGTARAIRFVR